MQAKPLYSFVLLALLCTSSCRSPDGTAYHRPSPAEMASEERRIEERRLAYAGFEPLAVLASRSIEVQRVDFIVYLLQYPAVELTRDSSGATRVTMKFIGHREEAAVSASVWDQLAAQGTGAFTPPDPRKAAKHSKAVCHDWSTLEAVRSGREMRLNASPCLGQLQATSLRYGEALGRVAIDHLPTCAPDRGKANVEEALWSCGHRFGPATIDYMRLMKSLNPSDP